jgi:peptide-methionine (S)-S-oxide reductase
MLNLRQALWAAGVLAAGLAIGTAMNKSAPVNTAHYETATLAGGCFWGLQEKLRQIPGVIKTTAGYTGGTTPNPTFEQVAGGKTGHLEAVEVIFDPARLSYKKLLADFLATRNPTRQSTGRNSPQPSTIFYHNEGQRLAAECAKEEFDRSGKWKVPVLAQIKRATKFYPAEKYHQDYYQKMAACSCGLE